MGGVDVAERPRRGQDGTEVEEADRRRVCEFGQERRYVVFCYTNRFSECRLSGALNVI